MSAVVPSRLDGRLAIDRDTSRADAVTLWLEGTLDLRNATRLADECRGRLSHGQRVLIDLSELDRVDDDAVVALDGISAAGCLLFNATRSLLRHGASHVRAARVNAR